MLNPSNQFDLNIGWAMAHRQMVRNGDAWVGITDKPIDVLALKKFDPARYGSLSFANPLALDDPRNCQNPVTSVDPPSARSRSTEDGLAWDIYSQVGALVRSRDRANPLAYGGRDARRHGGHEATVKHVYGFGYSQTGGDLYDYINAIHPLDVARNGGTRSTTATSWPWPAAASWASCRSTSASHRRASATRACSSPTSACRSSTSCRSRTTCSASTPAAPDSDAPADRFRHYEMAGAAHATPDELNFAATSADIVKAGVPVPPMNCNEGPRSRFPSRIFFDAMLRNLDLWVRYGIRPPTPPRSRWRTGAGVLDEFGNVVGGLRSPYLDVPTSTWFGNSTGASFCIIAGHEVPFDASALQTALPDPRRLRPRRGQGHGAARGRALHHRYDGLDLIREAAQADVP